MEKIILKLKTEALYTLAELYRWFNKRNVSIMSIEDTINSIVEKKNSIIRFGDGEFSIMQGEDIDNYQICNIDLRNRLIETAKSLNVPNLLICMPETLSDLSICNKVSKKKWSSNFYKNRQILDKVLSCDYLYGNSFFSRPYMIYKDKSRADSIFTSIIHIFEDKEILLVEGSLSRSGVGNNLFEKAKSVNRILCPSSNAFEKYNEILDATIKNGENKLVLLAIGPTSKILALDLVKRGFWVIDIGHIDSEYEWYLRGAENKEQIAYKHTAENSDKCITDCNDTEYIKSIIATIPNN